MNKFCVAYMNYFDNELKQVVVECEDLLDAPLKAGFATQEEREYWGCKETMEEYYFEGDANINVIEIK